MVVLIMDPAAKADVKIKNKTEKAFLVIVQVELGDCILIIKIWHKLGKDTRAVYTEPSDGNKGK